MPTFGFWNVDSLRNLHTDERELPRFVADLALERSIDVFFLIECGIPCESLMAAFKGGPEYYPISCGERFKVLARFDPKLMQRLPLPVPSDRFDIWQLALPLQEDMLLSVVHGLDKRNNSPAKQELFLQQVVAALSYFENKVGHDRSIVFGDFNANPFESPVASALGMNAVISRAIAQSDPRRMLNQSYPYFYNPMWNLYGDEPRSSAPATYYYRGSDPHELYWHMLDQVLIRPSLLNGFDFSALDIVTTVRSTELTGASGTPDRTRFSDHLPVVFGVDLSVKNDKGGKHV
jgi:endonuclease/exonuclease/phosphatase family metal-dependent hydrolase